MRVKLIKYIQCNRGFTFSIAVPCQNGKPHSKLVEHGLRKVLEYILPMFCKHPLSYDDILSVSSDQIIKHACTTSAVKQGLMLRPFLRFCSVLYLGIVVQFLLKNLEGLFVAAKVSHQSCFIIGHLGSHLVRLVAMEVDQDIIICPLLRKYVPLSSFTRLSPQILANKLQKVGIRRETQAVVTYFLYQLSVEIGTTCPSSLDFFDTFLNDGWPGC